MPWRHPNITALKPEKHYRHFVDIFRYIFFRKEIFGILIQVTSKDPTHNKSGNSLERKAGKLLRSLDKFYWTELQGTI